jgi:SAM-dependent methyltransferase
VTGPLTLVPGATWLSDRLGVPGPSTANYAYHVWLRHIIGAARAGLPTRYETVAEMGPGRSLGTGIAALLCGTNRFFAWDIVTYSPIAVSLTMLDDLSTLFRSRAEAPEGDFSPAMFERRFPGEILPDSDLETWLAPDRLSAIRAALEAPGRSCDGIRVEYGSSLEGLEVPANLVLSQAVMEHVDDFEAAYDRMFKALAPDGVTSHQIDFKSHGFARAWNGHWTMSDRQWRVIRGRRTYAINRAPLHEHTAAIAAAGFTGLEVERITSASGIPRQDLRPRFAAMPEIDASTSSALVHAAKR